MGANKHTWMTVSLSAYHLWDLCGFPPFRYKAEGNWAQRKNCRVIVACGWQESSFLLYLNRKMGDRTGWRYKGYNLLRHLSLLSMCQSRDRGIHKQILWLIPGEEFQALFSPHWSHRRVIPALFQRQLLRTLKLFKRIKSAMCFLLSSYSRS